MDALEKKLKKYGLTKEQYKIMLEYSGNRCYICNRPPRTRALHIDHNHKTGVIRGLLCLNCNQRIIGRSGDKQNAIELFENVVKYLKENGNGFNFNLKEQEKSGKAGSNKEGDRSEGIVSSGISEKMENKSSGKKVRIKKRIQS